MTGLGRRRADQAAIAAGLVTVGLWASAFVGLRAVAGDFSGGSIALGRLVVASVALAPLALRQGTVRPSPRAFALIAAAGVTWLAGYAAILSEGERLVDAGTAALIVGTGPILIAVFAGAFLGEGFPPRLIAGCGVALAGTAIIGIGSATDAGRATTSPVGVLLCVLAAVLYGVGVTFQKPALRTVTALSLTWLAAMIGAIACIPFAPRLLDELGRAPSQSVAWLVYLGLFPTAIGFTTWAFALSRMPAGAAGAMNYLIAPAAIVIGFGILGERPSDLAIVGGIACLGGVAIARWRPAHE